MEAFNNNSEESDHHEEPIGPEAIRSLKDLAIKVVLDNTKHTDARLKRGMYPETLRQDIRALRDPKIVKMIEDEAKHNFLDAHLNKQCEDACADLWDDPVLRRGIKVQEKKRAEKKHIMRTVQKRKETIDKMKILRTKMEQNIKEIDKCQQETGVVPQKVTKQQEHLYKKYRNKYVLLRETTFALKWHMLHQDESVHDICSFENINFSY